MGPVVASRIWAHPPLGAGGAPSTAASAVAIEVEEPMKIGYQEQDESEAFFVPYTWEVIHAHTAVDLSWQGPRVAVFSLPQEKGGASSSGAWCRPRRRRPL